MNLKRILIQMSSNGNKMKKIYSSNPTCNRFKTYTINNSNRNKTSNPSSSNSQRFHIKMYMLEFFKIQTMMITTQTEYQAWIIVLTILQGIIYNFLRLLETDLMSSHNSMQAQILLPETFKTHCSTKLLLQLLTIFLTEDITQKLLQIKTEIYILILLYITTHTITLVISSKDIVSW